MWGPPVTLRCPSCGHLLATRSGAGRHPAWVACPTCGRPVAVVPLRDPPPLFSWEAHPQLYTHPDRPRRFGPPMRRVATLLLAVVTGALLLGAGLLAAEGARAAEGPTYVVGGRVTGLLANGTADGPLAGAWVNISGENGFLRELRTGASGTFSTGGVPAGGISVSAAATGYAPVTLDLFRDPVYSSPPGNLTGLALVLPAGSAAGATTLEESPYSDLESFVALLLGGTTLLGLSAVVGGVGLVEVARRERYAWAVAGGAAGALAPLLLFELDLPGILPLLVEGYDLLALTGVLTVFLGATALALSDPPEPPGP